MKREYPAYMTVIWCMVVALVVGFGGYDVGRRLGANAVRQEAIRAGAAFADIVQVINGIDRNRVDYVPRFRWVTEDRVLSQKMRLALERIDADHGGITSQYLDD